MRFASILIVALVIVAGCAGSDSDDGAAPTNPDGSTPRDDPTNVATPSGSADVDDLRLVKVADGFNQPVHVTNAGDGSGRLFVVEQGGRIKVVKDGSVQSTLFLDVTSLVSTGYERGLLSIAFEPDYESTGRAYVFYTARNGDLTIARYKAVADGSRLDPTTARVLLTITHAAFANHNGGMLAFGPDGYLYAGTGDGGGAGDPSGNAQNKLSLLGKLLRIDVVGEATYTIPSDNPFRGLAERGEIWAYGLRNPWRFSFDRTTGDLYIGDVGQNAWEEVDFQPAGSRGGQNYGWDVYEGTHQHEPGLIADHVRPVAEYPNRDKECSITGGHVYRGTTNPGLVGRYVFGDFCSGKVWTLRQQGGQWRVELLLTTDHSISSFGEDEDGQLYLVDHTGSVHRFD